MDTHAAGCIPQASAVSPLLKAGKLVISHTANILQYLGPRLSLAPKAEAQRGYAHGLQLTITDFVREARDVHHPIANSP